MRPYKKPGCGGIQFTTLRVWRPNPYKYTLRVWSPNPYKYTLTGLVYKDPLPTGFGIILFSPRRHRFVRVASGLS